MNQHARGFLTRQLWRRSARHWWGLTPGGLLACGAVVFMVAGAWADDGRVQEGSCSHDCLTGLARAYIAAVVAGDPSQVRLADGHRATENSVEVEPGDGLWSTVTGVGSVARYFADPVSQSAAFYGLLEEGETPALVAVRVLAAEGGIAEAEWVVARPGELLMNAEGFARDRPVERIVPAAERTSREDMRAAAAAYFDALEAPHSPDYHVPSVPGCPRVENGTLVTRGAAPDEADGPAVEFGSADCTDGLERMTQIEAVVERAFPVIDQRQGVVLARGVFLRPEGAARSDGTLWPRNYLMEFFTIDEGRIAGVHAVMHYLDPEAGSSGWE